VSGEYRFGNIPDHYFLVPPRLVPKNGVEFAKRGFAKIARYDVGLVIDGVGFLRASLEKLSRELGTSDYIKFLGEVLRERLLPLMKRSEAVIVPSVPANGVIEATSLGVLEAMAMGVPVIASAIGGIKEIIVNDSTGFLTPPGEPAAILRAMMAALARDDSARVAVAQNALRRVRDRFGSEAWIRTIQSTYYDITGKPPANIDTLSFPQ
jgi:glycosyltransferase involved in cell wall biosynthesis